MITVKTFDVNPLSENTYIVSDETREAIVIDCGAYDNTEQQAIADYIDSNKLRIVAHILTHAHFDHIFGAGFIYERYGIQPRCHAGDAHMLLDPISYMKSVIGGALRFSVAPAGPQIRDDETIHFGSHDIKVIPSPGHTPGGVCFYIADEKVLFSGDNIFQMSIGRTDFPGGNHWDLIRSLQHILHELPADVTIYPGHGPTTTIGFEREHNPFIS